MPPLTTIQVLGVLILADTDPGNAPDQEPTGDLFLGIVEIWRDDLKIRSAEEGPCRLVEEVGDGFGSAVKVSVEPAVDGFLESRRHPPEESQDVAHCKLLVVGGHLASQLFEERREVILESGLITLGDLLHMTDFDVLPPSCPSQVRRHARDDERLFVMAFFTAFLRLCEQKDILRMKDAGAMSDRDPAHVEAGRATQREVRARIQDLYSASVFARAY